jgi:hypothetical protein
MSHETRVEEEIREIEYWLKGFGQQAGVPRLRGLREAVDAALTAERTAREEAEELLQRSCEQRAALRDQLIEAEEALSAERAACAAIARGEAATLQALDETYPDLSSVPAQRAAKRITAAIEARGERPTRQTTEEDL